MANTENESTVSKRDAFRAAQLRLEAASKILAEVDANDDAPSGDYAAAHDVVSMSEDLLREARDAYRASDEPRTWTFRGDGGRGHDPIDCAPSDLDLEVVATAGDYGEIDESIAVEVYAHCADTDENEYALVVIDPYEPDCLVDAHDWREYSGLRASHRGGLSTRSVDVCAYCGTTRTITSASQGAQLPHDYDTVSYATGAVPESELAEFYDVVPDPIIKLIEHGAREAVKLVHAILERAVPDALAKPIGDVRWFDDDMYSYVVCCGGRDGDDPIDCYTRVGVDDADVYWIDDGDDQNRVDTCGPYLTYKAAREAAIAWAKEQDEGDGDDAETVMERRVQEAKDRATPNGEFAILWVDGDDVEVGLRFDHADDAQLVIDAWYRDVQGANPGTNILFHLMRHPVLGPRDEEEV